MTGKDLSFVVAMAVIAISVAMTASVAVAGELIEEALYAAIAWESTGSFEGILAIQHISCPCAAINQHRCWNLYQIPNNSVQMS